MKKKILVIPVFLLAFALISIPVMAVSPKKIPVTIDRSSAFFWTNDDPWISGNVQHCRDFTNGWNTYNIEGEGISLQGSTLVSGDYNINLENGHGAVQRDVVLTINDGSGTFEGQNNQRGIFRIVTSGPWKDYPVFDEGTAYAVFRGTEAYHGWTLFVTKQPGQPVEAYMLIP